MADRTDDTRQDEWNVITCDLLAGNRQGLWRQYCDSVYLKLLDRWLPSGPSSCSLKTDLYDEAMDEGLLPRLHQASRRIVGLDLSLPVAGEAGRKYSYLRATLADARVLPFSDNVFDLVLSNSTLDHFPSPEDIATALAELARVMTSGGELIITLDNLQNPIVRARSLLPLSLLRRTGIVPYYVGATHGRRGLVEALAQAGFEIKDLTAIMHSPRVLMVPIAQRLARAGGGTRRRFVRSLMAWEALEHFPGRYFTGHYVCARAVRGR